MQFTGATPTIVDTMSSQYPMHYPSAGKMISMDPSQSIQQAIHQPQFQSQPAAMTARDWQQSVASVYDPQGLKRRWNYSVDLSSDNATKRAG
jgi:hypothetical protein